jgi:hypothetical protein
MDSRYLVEKLYNMTVNQSYSAAQKELAVKEMEAKLNEVLHFEITVTLTLSLPHWAGRPFQKKMHGDFFSLYK